MMTEKNRQEFIRLRKELLEKEYERLNPQQRQAVFQIKGPGPRRCRVRKDFGAGEQDSIYDKVRERISFGTYP